MKWLWTADSEQAELLADTRGDKAIIEAIDREFGTFDGNTPTLSRSQLQQLADDQKVFVNGTPFTSKEVGKVRIENGMQIEIHFGPPKRLDVLPEDLKIEILYQDEHLVVVNKPQGMSTHPSDNEATGTLVNALLFHIKDLSGIGGVARPGIVHRLDKNTSGTLVVAKTDTAHQKLVELFAQHDLERRYWALCFGKLVRQGPYKVESLIGRNPTDRKKMMVLTTGGRNAITWLQTLKVFGSTKEPHSSLVEAKLETGRTHQVRVHLTQQGASIIGDTLYGVPTENQAKFKNLPHGAQLVLPKLKGQALHARVLAFQHPITQKDLRFEAEPPALFMELAQALENE